MSKEAKAKKPFYKRIWFWLIVVVIVILGACSSGSDSSDEASTEVTTEQDMVVTESSPEAVTESTETATTTKKEAVATQPSKPVESSTEAQATAESTEDTESEKDAFIDQVTEAIQGGIGEGESITGVSLNDENVLITVDLSQVDPAPLTMEDLALSRVGSITDAFLEITDYDDLWTSVTIDFGSDIGKVTCYKDDIESNGYGRYFPEEKYALEQ